MYQSLLSSFSAQVHAAKSSYFHIKINNAPDTRNLFKTFNSLLCPPAPPPTTSITADDFATFFTNKTTTISSQFSAPHVQELIPTTSTANTPLFSFCPLSEAEESKLLLSSHPTTCPLDPIPSHLLQAISPTLLPALTHIINTSLLTGTFPTAFKQARYRCFSRRTVHWMLTSQGSGVATQLKLHYFNHQILLSTLSSLGITGTPLRWFESYLTDLNRESVSEPRTLSGRLFQSLGAKCEKALPPLVDFAILGKNPRGVPRGSVLGPLLFSTYTTSLGPIIQAHGFSYHCYADDTQLYLSFQPDDPTVAARISGCLADISEWMKEHHLQLNLAKTELLIFHLFATPTLQHDFTINYFNNYPIKFALHNIRKIRPFLTEQATQLLVQALVIFRLDYCNALLAGLPSCTIKPLQMIQNAAARLVFNEPKRAHVTPLFITLHWLPVAARIKFKTLMLIEQPQAQRPPTSTHCYQSTLPPEL
ncbi:hypothetical protein H4Q32_026596 [Labeo rohita]|uniref:Reverse transcriptase domain-containing protein n=1 Tax=Labeo rohita TaxID=84645 RepID=A0ABQ8LB55_LABRO|nr:hypothetical protein H4Q32_026596 [Labeo rohita]